MVRFPSTPVLLRKGSQESFEEVGSMRSAVGQDLASELREQWAFSGKRRNGDRFILLDASQENDGSP